MFKRIISALISVAISTQSLAQCPKPVTLMLKGEAAPCDGFLFSYEKELELRIKNEEYKLLTEKVKLYSEQVELYKKELESTELMVEKEQKKAELWRTAAESSTQKYLALEENKEKRDWLFLLTGVALTVLAGWSLGQVGK